MEKYLHVEAKHKHINTSINMLKTKLPKLQKTVNVHKHFNKIGYTIIRFQKH